MYSQSFSDIKTSLISQGYVHISFSDLKSSLSFPGWMDSALVEEGFMFIEVCDPAQIPLPTLLMEPDFNFHAVSIGSVQHLSQVVAFYPIIGAVNSVRYQGLWAKVSVHLNQSYWVMLAYPTQQPMKFTESRILLQDIATELIDCNLPHNYRAA